MLWNPAVFVIEISCLIDDKVVKNLQFVTKIKLIKCLKMDQLSLRQIDCMQSFMEFEWDAFSRFYACPTFSA